MHISAHSYHCHQCNRSHSNQSSTPSSFTCSTKSPTPRAPYRYSRSMHSLPTSQYSTGTVHLQYYTLNTERRPGKRQLQHSEWAPSSHHKPTNLGLDRLLRTVVIQQSTTLPVVSSRNTAKGEQCKENSSRSWFVHVLGRGYLYLGSYVWGCGRFCRNWYNFCHSLIQPLFLGNGLCLHHICNQQKAEQVNTSRHSWPSTTSPAVNGEWTRDWCV